VRTFGHCDIDALRAALAGSTTGRSRPAVLTDGVFSALGHIAPLAGYREVLRGFGFSASMLVVDDTPVPIVCLEIGSGENMCRVQEELMRRGIAVAYMSAYSGLGPEGALRLAVFATHTEAMIGQLLDGFARLL